jgi:hypothetical protein
MSTDRITLPAVEVPVLGEYDVIVCGGGPAGTAAAIGAARLGARTLLIERYNHLGGLATGGQVILLPRFFDKGRQIIGGIGMETRERLFKAGFASYRSAEDSCCFDVEGLKSLSIDMLREAGADILLHSWCSDAVVQDGQLTGVVTVSKAGRQAFLGKMIIDTTGDLEVAASAGADFEKSIYGIGVPFRIGGVDLARWQTARREKPELTREVHNDVWKTGGWQGFLGLTPVATPEAQFGVVWANNTVRQGDGLDPAELTALEIEGRDMARRALEVLRRRMPGYEKAWIIDVAVQTGVRITRRLGGDYVLTDEDVAQFDFRHPDSVARGNDFRKEGIAYDIPRASLVSRNIPNLLSAGRSLSSTHVAMEPIREIHVCWTSGHAAGVIAARAVKEGKLPRELCVVALRSELLKQGAVVGGPEDTTGGN